MKRQTDATILFKLLAFYALITGIIAIIFLIFLNKPATITPSVTPSITPIMTQAKPQPKEGKFCGGIAGIACPTGFTCKLSGTYPDAGGVCVK